MRFRIKIGFGLLGFILTSNLTAQNLTPQSGNVVVTHYMPVFEYKVETGSNTVPLGFASRVAVGGYVNPDKMAAYLYSQQTKIYLFVPNHSNRLTHKKLSVDILT